MPAAATFPVPAPPCIDVHCHLPARGPEPDPETMAAFRALAATSGVERMVLLGDVVRGGPHPSPEVVRSLNSHTLAAVRAAPDLFSGLCYLNPAHGAEFCLAEMERTIVVGGLVGVKLWIAVDARRPELDPILSRAAELGVPVLHHAWYKTVGWIPEESDPDAVAELAARHPRTTIIMAHLGGHGWRGVRAVRGRENVLVDTSGSFTEAELVEFAVRLLGPERVLFGSDMPGRDVRVQRARIDGARLGTRAKELVLAGKARRVLPLGPPPAARGGGPGEG